MPTTAGTGSETTAVAVTHVLDQNVKAGVSHRLLRPSLGVVDPLNTLTAPPEVTAAAGADILTPRHRVVHDAPVQCPRPSIIRRTAPPISAPIRASDIWCEKAMEYVAAISGGRVLSRSRSRGAGEPRAGRQLRGYRRVGNAGVHIPTRVAYPIAGLVRDCVPQRLPHPHHAMVPHGMAVISHRASRLPLHLSPPPPIGTSARPL